MRVLVTGGAGFIGSNFIKYWLQNHPNDEVIAFDALTYAGNRANFADLEAHPDHSKRFKFVHGDITDQEAVRKVMEGVDIVAHFAANSHVDRSIVEPGTFVNTNVVGTHVLLEEARRAKVWRFHHVSTDEVYGTLTPEGDELFTEESRYEPNNPYSASKAASDCLVRAYFKTYDLPATITNTSNNFGPYQFPEKYIPLSISRILDGKNIRVHGKGDHVRDWIYVEDHCRAIETVLKKGKLGEVYLVAGRAQLSILEVAKRICKLMGVPESRIEHVPDRPANDLAYKLDWTKINKELGWEPLYSFDEWLQKTIDWYIANEAWWRPLVKNSFAWGVEKQDAPIRVPMGRGLDLPKAGVMEFKNAPMPDKGAYGVEAQILNAAESAEKPVTFLEAKPEPAKDEKKVLIFGRGQLSMHYKKYYESFGFEVTVMTRPEADIRNFESVKAAIQKVKPNLVINAAGITNIDWSELNKEETYQTNTVGADNIGRACQEAGVFMVHLSSGCVHNSDTLADIKAETTRPTPLCYYSVTKIEADELLLKRMYEQGLRVLIVRPRQLLSAVPHPKNVLAKMLIYTKFHDKPNSMTVIEDLVWVTDELMRRGRTGLYNVVNPGITTPYKIAQMIKEVINPDLQIQKLSKEEIDAMYSVPRADAILSTEKLGKEGIFLPDINERIKQLLTVLRDNLLNDQAKNVLAETKALNDSKMAIGKK